MSTNISVTSLLSSALRSKAHADSNLKGKSDTPSPSESDMGILINFPLEFYILPIKFYMKKFNAILFCFFFIPPINCSTDDIRSKSNRQHQQYRPPDQIDPAILSCGPRPISTPIGSSKMGDQHLASRNESPSSDIIRYSRERLLGLRNTEMSRRKPDYIDDRRFWCRLGNPNGGSDNADNSAGLSRYESRSDYHRGKPTSATLSASSSTSSLANSTSSSYLLPSFACKRRPTGGTTGTTSTDTKDRVSAGLRKETTSADQSTRRDGTSGGDVAASGKPVLAYRKAGGNGESTGEALGRDRRIGSGRIPMRDVSWNDYKSDKDSSAPSISDGGATDAFDRNTSAKRITSASTTTARRQQTSETDDDALEPSARRGNENYPWEQATPPAKTGKSATNDSEYNFRPSGGLLGLRDRERGGESQPNTATLHQPHPILPRSLIDKDRNDYRVDPGLTRVKPGSTHRSRSPDNIGHDQSFHRFSSPRTVLSSPSVAKNSMMNDERYDRRPFNRDYNLGSMDKERNMRGASSMNHHHNSNSNSRYGSNNSHYNNNSNNHHHHGDHRRRMYESRSQALEEPEWFSGGPTSQNDVIELRGFDDPPASETKSPAEYDDNFDENADYDENNDEQFGDNNKATEDDQNARSSSSRLTGWTKGNSSDLGFERHGSESSAKLSSDSNNNKDADGTKNSSQKTKKRSTDGESGNDGDAEDNSNDVNKNEENFNFEDFLKLDSITDLLSVSVNNK